MCLTPTLRYLGMEFSRRTVIRLAAMGWIVDGRGGGLVLGRRHAEGNIYMVKEQPGGRHVVFSHMEGGEYLLNHRASQRFMERVREINDARHETGEPLPALSPRGRIVCTCASPHDRLMLVDSRGQFIVNRHSTAAYLDELERMNEAENDFGECDLDALVPRRPVGR